MFLLDDGTIVYSASDLADAAACELAVLRALDGKLGRAEPLVLPVDAMVQRAARLGDRHEERVLAELVERHGPWDRASGRGVAQIERPPRETAADRDVLAAKHAETLDVLHAGADVVFQAGFFDGRFSGWADFLVRGSDGATPAYAVHDTKLARHAKVTALLQLAAYADQLLAAGVPTTDRVHLILGDRSETSHRLPDLLPVYRDRRGRLQRLLDRHQDGTGTAAWGDDRYRACGRCDVCRPEVTRHRDLLLVAGMRSTQRARLRAAGITTIDALAAGTGTVPGIGDGTLGTLRAQARLQVVQDPPRAHDQIPAEVPPPAPPTSFAVEVFAPEVIAALPTPDSGDIFFDFEGDPLWAEATALGTVGVDWGLEYLFGWVEAPAAGGEPAFHALWAHDRAQEKQALLDFLAYLTERRRRHPGMHVYHYAAYERTALLRLAGRHGVAEDVVDELLRDGVLVDLYATVRASVRTGQPSYSLKQLEPLYMSSGRTGDVTTAGDSIVEYADACVVRDAGDPREWQERLDRIAEYNEYDCRSTLGLRDWLLARAAEGPGTGRAATGTASTGTATTGTAATGTATTGTAATGEGSDAGPRPDGGTGPQHGGVDGGDGDRRHGDRRHGALPADAEDAGAEPDAVAQTLLAFAGPPGPRTADQQAVAMLHASLGYHRRESKPFWWGHFNRLTSEPAEWTERRSTFVADEVQVLQDWHVPQGRQTSPRRRLRMTGTLDPGSDLRPGTEAYALYDAPLPVCARTSRDGRRGWTEKVTVLTVDAEGTGADLRDVLVIEDGLRTVDCRHDELPMGLAPAPPPPTDGIAAAIRTVAEHVSAALPALPAHPAVDLLRRRPPRTRSGGPLPPMTDGPSGSADAIVAAVLDLDRSYLAVQGPPGTGKTHTGADVIAALVRRGWRVGVVAQSHAVVENLLTRAADAGIPPDRIGKRPNGAADPGVSWQALTKNGDFAAFYQRQGGGYLVGGTAWDFTNARRMPSEPLDLLVVDEAGQLAVATTVAVSTAARNLLLLGDPQQLPQVSQGTHPEPVDRSALGWLTDGHDTLPDELGYFLAHTWRMHPDLTEVVSHLSYEGRLRSMACTAERSLDGVAPGVRCVLVDHRGNAVASTQEADAVVQQVRDLVGRRWRDPAEGVDRPLEASDVLVVAAYNAQVWTIRRALDTAGLSGARVGTVDRFQGQQAPVVVLSTAASSPEDVPRGMEFLLNRNRLNVAVSRGQWCAVVVRATGLTDHLPARPEALEELGAFMGLCRS